MRAVAAALLLAAGCAPATMYRWGGYDEILYAHYKNPAQNEEFIARLAVVIADAERTGSRVPPGCYAEYGWALYEEGRLDQAAGYFEKEAAEWPESRILMQKLIRNARRGTAPAPVKGPAGEAEGAPK